MNPKFKRVRSTVATCWVQNVGRYCTKNLMCSRLLAVIFVNALAVSIDEEIELDIERAIELSSAVQHERLTPLVELTARGNQNAPAAGVFATSDFRGNLGPARVILVDHGSNGYTDRWQCASPGKDYEATHDHTHADMSGKPVEGEHWLMIDLGSKHDLARFEIQFEYAHAKHYVVEARAETYGPWNALRVVHMQVRSLTPQPIAWPADSSMAVVTGTGSQILHVLTVDPRLAENARSVRYVRLRVASCSPVGCDTCPRADDDGCATHYCWSVWRFKIFGL